MEVGKTDLGLPNFYILIYLKIYQNIPAALSLPLLEGGTVVFFCVIVVVAVFVDIAAVDASVDGTEAPCFVVFLLGVLNVVEVVLSLGVVTFVDGVGVVTAAMEYHGNIQDI